MEEQAKYSDDILILNGIFLNRLHRQRYQELIQKANVHSKDLERKVLFYILSGHDDMFNKINSVYDFEENLIKPNFYELNDFSSGIKIMIQLAFNLYNGNQTKITPLDLIDTLDNDLFDVALIAIKIRRGLLTL